MNSIARLMKTLTFSLRLLPFAMLPATATAALISQSWNNVADVFDSGGVVPDTLDGWSDTRTLSGITATTITNVRVTLTITGYPLNNDGWNGDLYAYLTHSSGFSVLLNRPGRTSNVGPSSFGYGDSGMNVVFDDSAANDIHNYQTIPGFSILGGASWQPDGRSADPFSVLDTDTRDSILSSFNGLNPNGDWTLFVADMSGGAQSTVTSWGLQISAVPEPVNAIGTALLLGSACLIRMRPRGKR